MVDLSNINFEESETTPAFEPMPDGWYTAEIIESEDRLSNSGNKYLSFTFEINDDGGLGQFIGRRVWYHVNNSHPDEAVRTRALRDLARLAESCKVVKPKDSEELHGIPLDIKLAIEEGKEGVSDRNKVLSFRISKGVATPPKPKSNGGNNRPWET